MHILWPDIITELGLQNHYKQIGGLKITENPERLKLLYDMAQIQVITDKQILKTM